MPGTRKSHAPRGWHMIDEIDLVPLTLEHSRWRQLCLRLEAIADALPAMPSTIEIAALRAQLREAFPADRKEPDFPLRSLFEAESRRTQARRLLDQLRERRVAFVGQAQDLADMIGSDDPSERMTPDTLGYMLRSIFAGCSESIGLELLALLFIAPERLTAAARALLLQHIHEDEPAG